MTGNIQDEQVFDREDMKLARKNVSLSFSQVHRHYSKELCVFWVLWQFVESLRCMSSIVCFQLAKVGMTEKVQEPLC